MKAAVTLGQTVGIAAACAALAVSRAGFYRARRGRTDPPAERGRSPLALPEALEGEILAVLHSTRFMDQSPYQIYATLLDEGRYLCSIRSFYRILGRHGEVRERRNQARRPVYAKPELIATGPNQVWSWDITKLKGPTPGVYFHLYVIIDLFSRCVVGWMVAERESTELAKRLIAQTCQRQGIAPGQLTIHADRGSSMTSKGVEQLLIDLGVAKSHSRPHVSNDNPFSEAQFKTLKYRPDFPPRFGSIEDARAHCVAFFDWYNHTHYHSAIALLTPASVHTGRAEQILIQRNQVLAAAFAAHPERFRGKPPVHPPLPAAAWINPPKPSSHQGNTASNDSPELH
jgi:transposase InsO family protein